MSAFELLPAVDVADGQAVRLVQGAAGTETGYGDPLEAAMQWQRDGAQWIHLVDLDAAFGRGDNRDLIATYKVIREDVEALVRRLEIHRRAHDEAHYYDTRARWNDPTVSMSAIDRAATFIYLNKTCFNGLWRVNRTGAFNVPMGRYTDPPICVPDALRAAQSALANAELRCADYQKAVADAKPGDFLYFDPPYDPVTATANFTSYSADGFSHDDQRALADMARDLVARGCKVMLSNSDTPFIRSIYKGLRVERVKCPRAINSNAAKRGDVDELLITGGY